MNYLEKTDVRRFVPSNLPLLLLPQVDSQELNGIESGTVVEVEDFVEVNQEVWLYVTIPVFDTPINMKGWIKEIDTQVYTEETQDLVKSPIMVKEGTTIYEVDFFDQIHSGSAVKADSNYRCFISDRQGDYLALGCAGGKSIIVKKADAIYPPLQE